jgi:prepilin-type N-terminal cleavage/methylation domain-containing protein
MSAAAFPTTYRDASRPVARPRGFTLVEVVLVLSLLVVIAAVSIPFLNGSFSRAHLNSASDILRDAWSRGRLSAMQSGQIQAFRFEPKGTHFQLVSLDKLSLPESNEPPFEDPDAEHEATDILRLSPSRLPDNVIFAAGDVAASSQVAATLGALQVGTWSAPILFNPDGTTSDASLLLQNDRGQTIRVTLRGLTGIANAGDVGREEVP